MDSELHYDDDWREQVRLRDGRMVVLRLGRPGDRALLERGFERLSPESRYRRFLAAKERLTDAELDYLTRVDQRDHVAIGAFERTDDGMEGLGVARFVRLADRPNTAEAAIAVIDDAQGVGLGGLLFSRLAAAARERGVERFASSVLGDNRVMQELVASMADEVEMRVEDGVIYGEFELPEIDPTNPPAEPPRAHGFYRLLRDAARGRLRVRRLFRA